MKTPFNAALVCSIFCAMSHVAYAQKLWSNSEYGMSVDDVKASIPGANKPNDPKTMNKAEEKLRLDDVELIGKKFSAAFYFSDGKLSQVTLSLKDHPTFDEAKMAFEELSDVLTSKYGNEISHKSKESAVKILEKNWLSGRTNISLVAFSVGGDDANLSITYQTRTAKEADKL